MSRATLRTIASVLLTSLVFVTAPSHAQLTADPLPGDPRLVVFPYDENNSYRIFSKPLAVTHVVLERDERIKYLAIGDTSTWDTTKKDNHLFIKPKRAGASTSGTLLTTKREYQLALISTGEGGRWYQRVSFEYPGMIALAEEAEDRALVAQVNVGAQAGAPLAAGMPPPVTESGQRHSNDVYDDLHPDPAKLNFAYEVEGTAPFKPVTIYDNGKTTYIKLPEDASVPALFAIVDGEAQLVEYTHRAPDVLVVPSAIAAGLLKLGAKEVKFYNMAKMKKNFFGSYVERTK